MCARRPQGNRLGSAVKGGPSIEGVRIEVPTLPGEDDDALERALSAPAGRPPQ